VAKVLRGLNVVEMGTFITGPAAAMYLGDLGADVIKVERPGTGDPFRAYKGELYSPHYQTFNRNKRSIELDTSNPSDLEVFDDLIRNADVFIQNFRPGVAEKLGAGEARLRQLNPRLIYCSISGFGRTGPASHRPGYDTVSQAASAFLSVLIPPEHPRIIGPAIGDNVTGFYTAFGVLAALFERQRTGRGRLLEISMLEAMSHFNLDAFTHFFAAGEVMNPHSRPSVSQSYIFKCADDGRIAIHLSSPEKFWQGLAAAIDRPKLFDEPLFSERHNRIKNQAKIVEYLAPIFSARPRAEWCVRLEANEVPYSPVYSTDEALDDPQAKHLQLAVEMNHPVKGKTKTVRPPYNFDGERILDVRRPPTLGEHNDEIRREVAKRKSTAAQ
jgi:crotonobetainyl-CoA:carnitine CoA-transferase CaiB-like acyl-CoA transferase